MYIMSNKQITLVYEYNSYDCKMIKEGPLRYGGTQLWYHINA